MPDAEIHRIQPAPQRSSRWHALLVLAALLAAQAYSVAISPPEVDMGHLQKILYVHVPAAWSAFVAFFVVLVFSVLYLWRRKESHDLIAASAAEVGALFNGLALILGMIWGRPTWGVWWAWDARLTSTLVLFLIFVGYLALRGFVDDPQQRARWSAAVGIFGALNVPLVYMSVVWWRTLHQELSTPSTLDPAYTLGLRLNAIAMLLVMGHFIRERYVVARVEWAADQAAQAAAMGGEDR